MARSLPPQFRQRSLLFSLNRLKSLVAWEMLPADNELKLSGFQRKDAGALRNARNGNAIISSSYREMTMSSQSFQLFLFAVLCDSASLR